MFLTKEQVEKRLNSNKNLARATFLPREVEVNPEPKIVPVTPETKEIPQETIPVAAQTPQVTEKVIPLPGKNKTNLSKKKRTEIAIRARSGESQISIARAENLLPLTVSNIATGKTKGIDEEKVSETLDQVKDRALDRLMCSLGLLSDDKLSGCSAKDLSVIASNMGRVVEKITPKVESSDNINFIIYSPELKQERAYKTVEV